MIIQFPEHIQLDKWYREKCNQVWATGWRRHGAKVGDQVKFYCEWDYRDDELYEEIKGEERPIELVIENYAVGTIVELLDGDLVKVELPCTVLWWDGDLPMAYEDTEILEGDILDKEQLKELHRTDWAFKVIEAEKPKVSVKQLPLFNEA